jgi:hypothetical protein
MWYVHINRGVIDGNRKHDRDEAPVAVRNGIYGKSVYGRSVLCTEPTRIRYDRGGILPCGAKVVIETDDEPIIEA